MVRKRNLRTHPGAERFLPEATDDLEALRDASQSCRGCPLYKDATQAVFGEGSLKAKIMVIGEQPGSQEDLEGRPFVGPAGRLFDQALDEAEIDRADTYVTNAVKHFKFRKPGKIRLHVKPSAEDIEACRPWLEAELKLLRPKILICLGLTAARAIYGKAMKLKEIEGKAMASPYCERTYVLKHPSALLRIPDSADRKRAFAEMVSHLRRIRRAGY